MLSAEIILLILIIITAKYRRQQQCPTHIIGVEPEREKERGEGVERAAEHTNFNGYARQRLVQRPATANGFHYGKVGKGG